MLQVKQQIFNTVLCLCKWRNKVLFLWDNDTRWSQTVWHGRSYSVCS